MKRSNVLIAIGVAMAFAISGVSWASTDATPVVIAKNDKGKGKGHDHKHPHDPRKPSSSSSPSKPRDPRPPSSGPHSGPHDRDCKAKLDAAQARIEALKAELETCRRHRH